MKDWNLRVIEETIRNHLAVAPEGPVSIAFTEAGQNGAMRIRGNSSFSG